MKLKIYRLFLIILFSLLIPLTVLYFINNIKMLYGSMAEEASEIFIFIFALLIFLALDVLHIVNTIRSFKKGSTFIYTLYHDEYGKDHPNTFIVSGILCTISLFISVYSFLCILGVDTFGSTWFKPLLRLLNLFSLLLTIDSLFVTLYPLVKKLDKKA